MNKLLFIFLSILGVLSSSSSAAEVPTTTYHSYHHHHRTTSTTSSNSGENPQKKSRSSFSSIRSDDCQVRGKGVFRRSAKGMFLTNNKEQQGRRTITSLINNTPLNTIDLPTTSLLLLLRGGGNDIVDVAEKTAAAAATATSSTSSSSSSGGIFGILGVGATWIGATSTRCWLVLLGAIIVEIKATTLTKTASDTGDPMKMIASLSMYLLSLILFAASLPQIEVSIAYAVWSGLGTALVSIAGITMFGESCDTMKLLSISLIMLGVIGLNIQGGGH